ncbi:bifunctional glutamate N-acetyltransferase/amino-acid acetyltransferase ArgJ [Varunaivibrio sulfuroxidans]|uniref:Arginine biosynthesis bifunctional protein ArgJ n=1 Tax=Varunaivibrio sulfuroxidans TaxID=1773489 RepID=A0A4R3JEG6_9PROT|nr:bifunctional glutamate N-acetyltransferase/amino-acid acetyltransferase ArgJ [Varunaivibrio sulfuroxidans]TCS63496.1 glutamate N-acetyltransferase [Varunaivibrio sulfuroxidans]WES30359.1 bifunctional glutamate N-acetyltransferase/amino-acid acetyltransferase ArgJ [Varunaivibrio sulfuroxidans]
MSLPVSPLAPASFPKMTPLGGVRLAVGACGVRYKERTDVLLVELAPGATVGGVFTRSKTASASVLRCRAHLPGGAARALLVNSGNANAFTGARGVAAVDRVVATAANVLGCAEETVFTSSTGVIGEPLPDGKLTAFLPTLKERLDADRWEDAARAIMTTDTFAKGSVRTARIGGATVRIQAIAKGSGMIAPDMATMLAYVFTDAKIPAPVLQALVAEGAERSFNAITVDSDTSTSDTLLAFATGHARHAEVEAADDPILADFRAAFDAVLIDLAHQIVRDGEGARKFVTIAVGGAQNDVAARKIGLAIANSPLVKTAIAGEDANWGRIVMAIGKAGEAADRDRIAIAIGGVEIARDGEAVPDYDETPVARHMKGQEIDIAVDVGVGTGAATVWTCDLTHGYIDINADYRS